MVESNLKKIKLKKNNIIEVNLLWHLYQEATDRDCPLLNLFQ